MSGVCYDRLGAGVVLTQIYLSEEQAQRLLARLRPRKPGPPTSVPETLTPPQPPTP